MGVHGAIPGSSCLALWCLCMFVVQEQTLHELQLRVKQQSVEVEKGNALCQKVSQEKAQLEIHTASISTELQEANRRCVCETGNEKCYRSTTHTSFFFLL